MRKLFVQALVAFISALQELPLVRFSLWLDQKMGDPHKKMKCPQMERVSFKETSRILDSLGREASWGPQLASAKAARVTSLVPTGKKTKAPSFELDREEKDIPGLQWP
jgi:hypothetical protein